MTNREAKAVVRSTARMLRAVRTKRMAVLANPFEFDAVCDVLDRRANFIEHAFCLLKRPRAFAIRRRLYTRTGYLAPGLAFRDGLPVTIHGGPVLHPSGQPWTIQEAAAELAQVKYRTPGDTPP